MDDDDTVLFAVLAGLGGLAMLSLILVGVGVVLLLAWSMSDRPGAPVAMAPMIMPPPATATAQPSPSSVALALPLVAAPQDPPTIAPTATPLPPDTPMPTDTPLPTLTSTPTLPAPPVFQSGGLGQPRTWWEEHFGPQIEIYGMPGYGDFNVLFMPGGRAGHIERQFDPAISLEAAQAIAATLLPSDAQFIERYSPQGRPETVVDLYLSPSLAQNYPDASEWEYYPPGQFIVLYNVFESSVARFVVALGNNP